MSFLYLGFFFLLTLFFFRNQQKGAVEACRELGIPEIDIYADGYLDDHSAPVSHNLSFKPQNSKELCDFTLSAIVSCSAYFYTTRLPRAHLFCFVRSKKPSGQKQTKGTGTAQEPTPKSLLLLKGPCLRRNNEFIRC